MSANEQVLLQFGHLKYIKPGLLLIAERLLMFCSISQIYNVKPELKLIILLLPTLITSSPNCGNTHVELNLR